MFSKNTCHWSEVLAYFSGFPERAPIIITPIACERSFHCSFIQSSHRHCTAAMDSIIDRITSIHPLVALATVAIIFLSVFYFKYRNAIARRIKQVEEESWVFGVGVTMQRTTNNNKDNDLSSSSAIFSNLRLLELSPSFRTKYGNQWSLVSLGEYMSSLQPSAPLAEADSKT
jgi:hypothetical protein